MRVGEQQYYKDDQLFTCFVSMVPRLLLQTLSISLFHPESFRGFYSKILLEYNLNFFDIEPCRFWITENHEYPTNYADG